MGSRLYWFSANILNLKVFRLALVCGDTPFEFLAGAFQYLACYISGTVRRTKNLGLRATPDEQARLHEFVRTRGITLQQPFGIVFEGTMYTAHHSDRSIPAGVRRSLSEVERIVIGSKDAFAR